MTIQMFLRNHVFGIMKLFFVVLLTTTLFHTVTYADECEYDDRKDYYGNDQRHFEAADVGACCNACKADAICTHFTYKKSDKLCFMKVGTPGDIRDDEDAISGKK